MNNVTPQFKRKIHSHAVKILKDYESIKLETTSMDGVRNISAYFIIN